MKRLYYNIQIRLYTLMIPNLFPRTLNKQQKQRHAHLYVCWFSVSSFDDAEIPLTHTHTQTQQINMTT